MGGLEIVEEATSHEGLASLAAEWAELWARCPQATPFTHPAWLVAWAETLGRWNRPHALALRQSGRLLGLVPLNVWTNRTPRGPGGNEAGLRTLLLLGTGVTDLLDALLAPEAGPEAADAVLAHLGQADAPWDRIDLQALEAMSPLLAASGPAGWADEVEEQDVCPEIVLPAEGPAAPKKLRRNLALARNRAERMGGLVVERAETPEAAADALGGLVRLHTARWEGQGEAGVLADPTVRAFHERAAPRLLEAGLLRLYTLRIGGQTAAALYALATPAGGGAANGRRTYAYLSGFDTAYDAASPGALVMAHAVEEAQREGCTRFSFLRGREAYKYAWGAEDRPLYRRRLARAEP